MDWAAVASIIASMVVIVGAGATFVSRSVKGTIKREVVSAVAATVIPQLDEAKARIAANDLRLTRLEGIEEGKRLALAQASTVSLPAPVSPT